MDRSIVSGALEAKVRAEMAAVERKFKEIEEVETLLDFIKRPCIVVPACSGNESHVVNMTKRYSNSNVGFYRLTTCDSDEEDIASVDNSGNSHFIGFKKEETTESIQRYFICRDSQMLAVTEDLFPQKGSKKPLRIKLDLRESELIKTYASEKNFGYLLDPDFRVD